QVVDIFFERLNIHRPVLSRQEFDEIVAKVYEGRGCNPGQFCGVYLVLALGLLSERNHRAWTTSDGASFGLDDGSGGLLGVSPGWPSHEVFFEGAPSIKPDFRASVSGLQTLILFHWYMTTEV
ncbi:hypothetical protein AMATHDRAFT_94955, partial [Amanita thiersii Skay4041]